MESLFFPGITYTYLYCQTDRWSLSVRSGSTILPWRLKSTYQSPVWLADPVQYLGITDWQLLKQLLWRPAGDMPADKEPRSPAGVGRDTHWGTTQQKDPLHRLTSTWSNPNEAGLEQIFIENLQSLVSLAPSASYSCITDHVKIRYRMLYYGHLSNEIISYIIYHIVSKTCYLKFHIQWWAGLRYKPRSSDEHPKAMFFENGRIKLNIL